ncbi:aminoglycoside phosphotransferase family protein [Actinoalloteichus sp. AHMU CJ021]|uniref:phosphotransferase family protein n=1 Tax=Actinoalloteichus TaxID=65496 RepID=UPI0003657C54|nr:aminoglycoside phosphotransferase family protein [Actinoalloteichus spitiensis]AUS80390.1 aminoglycoside phosphotransferase family protein [Actinoalloteichus sp. AHMU CJ021]
MTPPATDVPHLLARLGHPGAERLAGGMEGEVWRLTGDLVAKVWRARTPEQLSPLVAFSRELADQGLPFATPYVEEVREVDGVVLSLERHLPGTSLADIVTRGEVTGERAVEITVEVVSALASTVAGPASRALPVFGEPRPLWAGHRSWGGALAALVRRRAPAGPAGGPLGSAVDELDRKIDGLLVLLDRVRVARPAVVHGDICPENILVDQAGSVTALLDWGFVSTAGDNAFDAATAAGFHDMYGPDAGVKRERLVDAVHAELGYPVELLLTYLAAYAVTGATAYSSSGADGHFAWCAHILNQASVTDLLVANAPR